MSQTKAPPSSKPTKVRKKRRSRPRAAGKSSKRKSGTATSDSDDAPSARGRLDDDLHADTKRLSAPLRQLETCFANVRRDCLALVGPGDISNLRCAFGDLLDETSAHGAGPNKEKTRRLRERVDEFMEGLCRMAFAVAELELEVDRWVVLLDSNADVVDLKLDFMFLACVAPKYRYD